MASCPAPSCPAPLRAADATSAADGDRPVLDQPRRPRRSRRGRASHRRPDRRRSHHRDDLRIADGRDRPRLFRARPSRCRAQKRTRAARRAAISKAASRLPEWPLGGPARYPQGRIRDHPDPHRARGRRASESRRDAPDRPCRGDGDCRVHRNTGADRQSSRAETGVRTGRRRCVQPIEGRRVHRPAESARPPATDLSTREARRRQHRPGGHRRPYRHRRLRDGSAARGSSGSRVRERRARGAAPTGASRRRGWTVRRSTPIFM